MKLHLKEIIGCITRRNKLKTPIKQITLLMGMLFIWKMKDFVNSSYITFIPFKTNDSRLNLYVQKKQTKKQINSRSFLK